MNDGTESEANVCLLVGHPRSGTTFLHRFMLENFRGLTGKKLEDMVFMSSSSSVQTPLKGIARRLPLAWLYRPEIHRTGMDLWECDDIAFSIHCRAGYLFWLYGRCRRRSRFDSSEFSAWVAEHEEDVISCWDRLYHPQLTSDGTTSILSKSFIMLFYLQEFLARHPNAKVILISRNPQEVVPSAVSLVNSVCSRLFPFRQLHEHAIANILHSVALYYREMSAVLARPEVKDRCLHLTYDDLTVQFSDTSKRIANYLPNGAWDEEAVTAQCATQSQRISAHHYNARDFGLTLDQIARAIPYG
jgi:hypothetical protein